MHKTFPGHVRALLLLLWSGFLLGEAVAGELLGHHALYEATLGDAGRNTGITEVRGDWKIEVEDHCETWMTRSQGALRTTGADDVAVDTAWRFVSFEAKDGSWYRFDQQYYHSESEGVEHSAGEAVMHGAAGTGRIVIEEPKPSSHGLPTNTVFPTVHLIDVLDRAADGERFMNHVVFDGIEGSTIYDVTTVVGSMQETAGEQQAVWPLHLAYFPQGDELPEVEISVRLRDDGVAETFRLIYSDITIDFVLSELTELPTAACERAFR